MFRVVVAIVIGLIASQFAFAQPVPFGQSAYVPPSGITCRWDLILSLRSQTAQFFRWRQHKQIPDFFKKMDPDGEEWKRLNLGNTPVGEEREESNFLSNLYESMMDDFIPWFMGKKDTGFRSMLLRQYRTLVVGRTGRTPYLGFTKRFPLGHLLPPRFRSPANPLQRLQGLRYSFPYGALRPEYEHPLRKLQQSESFMTIRLPQIPQAYWTTVYLGESELIIQFADDAHVDHFLSIMETLMIQMRTAVRVENPRPLLELVANYFQLANHAHPFPIGNTSMFLAQINFILNLKGFSGLTPAHLNHHAYVIGEVGFVDFLIEQIVSHR